MPYGESVNVDLEESALLAEIVMLAYLAKGSEGSLLDIKHTSQQTEAQYKEMCTQIVDGLARRPEWNHPEIKAYILGNIQDLPKHLHYPKISWGSLLSWLIR